MIGKLLSGTIKLVTLPIDIMEIGTDLMTGGDGSRKEMKQVDMPMLSNFRDAITDTIEKIDK